MIYEEKIKIYIPGLSFCNMVYIPYVFIHGGLKYKILPPLVSADNHKEREVTCTHFYSPGIISLTTPLDYESTKVYSLTVRATDVLSGSYGETKLQVNVLVRLANTTHMIEIDKRQIAHWSWTFLPWTFVFQILKICQSDLEVQTILLWVFLPKIKILKFLCIMEF